MDILSYIQRINQLYGSEQQVASGKGFGSVISEEFDELSPREEQYYQQGPFSTREDFLAAKGGSVYDTRKYFKPGGLVEPGVTHYATSPEKTGKYKYKVVNQWGTFWSDKPGLRGDTAGFREYITKFKGKEIYKGFVLDKANKFGIDRGTASRIIDEIRPDINELPYPETKEAKRKRLVVEKRLKKNFLDNAEFIKLHKNFEGSDLKFAEFLNEKGFTTDRGGSFTESAVYSRRDQLKLKTKTLPQSMSSYKTEAKELGIDIKGLDDQTIKNKVRFRRSGEIRKQKRLTDPDFSARETAVRKAWEKENPERVKESKFRSRVKSYEKFGMIQAVKNPKEELWRGLFEDGKRYKEGRRLKIVGDYGRYVSREEFLNAEILDTKTGKKITFKNLENYINPKNTGKTYAQVIKPYNQKWFVNETPGLRTEINSKLIPNWTAASKDNFFEIQHNAGRFNDPFDVSLSNESLNLKESQVRTKFEKMWNASDNLSDKKKAFSFYKENLPNEILSKPSMVERPRYFGTEIPFEEQLRAVKAKGVKLPKGTLKFIRENLDEFCTQKVASGGRIGFAGCTAEQILDNMKKDQQLLIEYKNTGKGINEAQAARIAEKFRNASGKVMKLGARGAKFMFGPALLWGEPLFEGAFVAHDMIGNKTPFAEALSKTYFAAPLKWAGILKEPEEYEAEALYRKRGDPGVEVIGARGMKRLERDKPGIIPGVKAYTDARSKLMKINDLRSKISNMEKEVESGVTLGAADALSSLKKQLSKEMSDIRYDEKSLHNIMKKNEQQYNIAVERLHAEKFKDVDPYVSPKGDPFGPLLDVTGDKRYQEMAEVNLGRAQQEGVFGHYVSPEKYEQIKNLASQSGEGQGLWQMFKKQIDDMGGPGFGPYKKMLAQGMEGPANRYTWGQVTTPAERYHLDRLGKLAELGGFSFEKAFGGRVPFGKGGMGRREFLKWIAGLAGGAAAFKTGLLSIIKGSKGKVIVKAGDHIITNTPGMPDWFIPLVNRIVKEGDDVTKKLGTIERETVHTAKIKGHDVDVYQDMTTGNIRVEVQGGTGKNLTAYDEGLQLEYKAGEVIDEGKHAGKKTDPEFSTTETEAGYVRTGPDDAELDFSGVKSGGTSRSISDTNFLKNYAKKKKTTLKEIAETTKKKKQIKALKDNPHEDPRIPEFDDSGMDDIFDEFGNLIE
jgi:hypothetical protein